MLEIENLKKSIGSNDLTNASKTLNELYDKWETLDEKTQMEIKDIEPVYLTMVNAQYE